MNKTTSAPYRGISWDIRNPRGWQVVVVFKGKQFKFFPIPDPAVAAWVSDFTKYILLGINPAMWYKSAVRPNFPPSSMDVYPRCLIVRKIADSGVFSVDELQRRLDAFDAAAV